MPRPLLAALTLIALFAAPGLAPGQPRPGSVSAPAPPEAATAKWPTYVGDVVVRDFRFTSGETRPELRLHYTTLGEPGETHRVG